MKKVLIITYYWPPAGGSGVQRWLKFTKYLPQYGWEPIIYTPENPELNSVDKELEREVPQSVQVIKRKIIEPYAFYKTLTGKRKDNKIQANIIADNSGSAMQKLSVFIRGNLFIPDPRCWWINPSVKFLKKYLKEHPVDVIVSTGPPHSMHLIAQKVSRNRGIKWVADFRDPWTQIFYFKHLNLSSYARNKHNKLELSVLKEADSVVVVSPQMKRDFETLSGREVELITNGYDSADFSNTNSADLNKLDSNTKSSLASGKFCLVHTGLMPQNGNPDLLWEVLGERAEGDPLFKKELLIVMMGQTDITVTEEIRKASLTDNFVDFGYVPHNKAIEWQKRADVLLLTLRKEPEAAAIITGKFFEYLASGNPLLAIGPQNGDLGKMLTDAKAGLICDFTDKETMRKAIDSLYANFKERGGKKENSLSDSVQRYSRKNLTVSLCTILNRLTDGTQYY
jgi:glycosyltransferase involved in cell wall biosynthesis